MGLLSVVVVVVGGGGGGGYLKARCVGVIWFRFHVLQLPLIRFTQQNSCCISKSTMKRIMQKSD